MPAIVLQLFFHACVLLKIVAGTNIYDTCDDIVKNENCDGRYRVIVWYDDVVDGADCQQRCNILKLRFFTLLLLQILLVLQ